MAVKHFNYRETFCGVSHFMNVSLASSLEEVTCKRCLKKLAKMTPEEICNICTYKSKANCKDCNNAPVECDQPS